MNASNIQERFKFSKALCRSPKVVADGPAAKLLVRQAMSGETGLEGKLSAKEGALYRPSKIACAGRCRGSRFKLYVRTPYQVGGAGFDLASMAELSPSISEVQDIRGLVDKTGKRVWRFGKPSLLNVVEVNHLEEIDHALTECDGRMELAEHIAEKKCAEVHAAVAKLLRGEELVVQLPRALHDRGRPKAHQNCMNSEGFERLPYIEKASCTWLKTLRHMKLVSNLERTKQIGIRNIMATCWGRFQ